MSETLMDRDLNLSNFRIKNVGTAVQPTDAISKRDLDLARPKIFNHIESFTSGDPDPDNETLFQLAYSTDIYSALVFVNGLLKAPSANSETTGNIVVRDYQIVAYSTYSILQFHNAVVNGSSVVVLYNTVAN